MKKKEIQRTEVRVSGFILRLKAKDESPSRYNLVDPTAIATTTIPAPGTPGFFNPIISNTPTSADIKVGTILFADTANNPIAGQVLLTNQYRPNPNLPGDIQINGTVVTGGGTVNIDSKGSIITNGLIDTSATAVNGQYLGNGGDVRLLANGNITFNPSSGINSVGLLGGNITLTSNGNISFNNANINSYNYTNVPDTTGGDINVTAKTLLLSGGSSLTSDTYGAGSSGAVIITTSGAVKIDGENSTFGQGNAGKLKIDVLGLVQLNGESRLGFGKSSSKKPQFC